MSELTQIQRKVWWILYLITTQNVFALPDPLFPLNPVYIHPRSNTGQPTTDNTSNGTNLEVITSPPPTGTSGGGGVGGEEPIISGSSSDTVIAEASSPFHRTRKGPPRPRKPPPKSRRHPPPIKAPMPPPPQSALIIKPSKLKQPNKDYMIYKHKVPKKNNKNRHHDNERPPYSILDPDHPPHPHHDHPPHPSNPPHPIHDHDDDHPPRHKSKPPQPFEGTSGENNSNRRPALRDLIKAMSNSAESKSFEVKNKHQGKDRHPHREREPPPNSSFNPDEYYPSGGGSGSDEKSYPPPPSKYRGGNSDERPPPPSRYNSGSSERPPPPPPSYSSGSSERPGGPPPYSSGSSERPPQPPPSYSSGSSERPGPPPPPYVSGSSELPRPPPKFPRGISAEHPPPPPKSQRGNPYGPPPPPKGYPQPSPSAYHHHHPGPAPFPKPSRPVKLSYYYDSNDKTDFKTLISSHHLKRRGKECDGLENFIYDLEVIAFFIGLITALIGLYCDVIPFFNEGVKINYSTNHGDGDDYPHDYWQTHATKIDAVVSKRQGSGAGAAGALGIPVARYQYPQNSRTIPITIGTKEDEIKEVVSVTGEMLNWVALGISFVALFPHLVEKFFYALDWWFGKRGLWKQYLYTYKCEVHPYPDPVGWGWQG